MPNKPTSTIPKTANKPAINPLHSRILLYGGSGTGRSTFAAQFPAIFFDLADTAQYLEVRRYPSKPSAGWSPAKRGKKPSEWQWFLDGLELCIREQNADMLVIDTIDRAFDLCHESVCLEHSIESPEENMRRLRQIYGQINREFARMLSRLRLFRGGVILIGGEEAISRDARGMIVEPGADNTATRRVEPSFKARSPARHKLRANIEELCGIIGRAVVDPNGNRSLVIQSSECLGKDRTGLLPKMLPLEYEAFCAPFRKAYSGEA